MFYNCLHYLTSDKVMSSRIELSRLSFTGEVDKIKWWCDFDDCWR